MNPFIIGETIFEENMLHSETCLSCITSNYSSNNTGVRFRHETCQFYNYEAYDVADHQSVVVLCVCPKKPETLRGLKR